MKRLVLIFFITILSSHNIWSQGVISLSGKVEDASSKRPLGFASIHLSGSTTSIVTNTDGMFVFKVPAEATGDTVIISYLGYKSRKIAVSDFEEREMNINSQANHNKASRCFFNSQDGSFKDKIEL